ncbi:MAG: ribosome recycling factor [Thermoflexales bacterium]|nr:ribosome recycling factor [Thermoflexales bacterium]MDW8351420.1 ribosome recycling factor [Anaerolineae bacterium]
MADEIKSVIKEIEKEMERAIHAMETDFQAIRTGRASPALVERIPVEYYGTQVPLQQLATITVPEAQVIMIKPFDPATLKAIEKAISASDVKLTPNNDGKVIRLNIPPLTEERRRDIVKLVHKRLEEAKISIRNHRREGMERLKAFEEQKLITEDDHKRGKQELENLTHRFTARADELGARKEREIMEL